MALILGLLFGEDILGLFEEHEGVLERIGLDCFLTGLDRVGENLLALTGILEVARQQRRSNNATVVAALLQQFTDAAVQVLEEFDAAEIRGLLAADKRFWLRLCKPEPEALHELGELLGLSPLAINDSIEFGQRPKIEDYPNSALLVAYGSRTEQTAEGPMPHPVEVHFHIIAQGIVTVRQENVTAVGDYVYNVGENIVVGPNMPRWIADQQHDLQLRGVRSRHPTHRIVTRSLFVPPEYARLHPASERGRAGSEPEQICRSERVRRAPTSSLLSTDNRRVVSLDASVECGARRISPRQLIR